MPSRSKSGATLRSPASEVKMWLPCSAVVEADPGWVGWYTKNQTVYSARFLLLPKSNKMSSTQACIDLTSYPRSNFWATFLLEKGNYLFNPLCWFSSVSAGSQSEESSWQALSPTTQLRPMTRFRSLETLPLSDCFPCKTPSWGNNVQTFEDLHWFKVRYGKDNGRLSRSSEPPRKLDSSTPTGGLPLCLRRLRICLQCGRPRFDPPGLGKFPREGNGNPPMDRGACWTTCPWGHKE